MASEIILYQTEDGQTKIQTRLENETVWLTQAQMAELFGKAKSTISEHVKNIFSEGELDENSVVRNFRTTAADGKSYNTNYFNLNVIISVGYRVKSLQGTKFRQWATARLREYIVKGFTLNDDLLKEAGGGNYFEELLARIRDIRSSEKVFWRKVLDIYATSIDYDPNTETSQLFFKTIQNKMHWAAHGQTAAEVIYSRIDAAKPYLGLTSFKGEHPTKKEIIIAKNYLKKDEIKFLNRIVTMYLDYAEHQAEKRIPMTMKDWSEKLNAFLKFNHEEILTNAGKITKQIAKEFAESEFEKYRIIQNKLFQSDFDKLIVQTKKKD